MPAAMVEGVLTRLRAQTRSRHNGIEQALDLMSEALTLPVYRRRLERFHGFYRPVEDLLASLGGWPDRGLDLELRRKTPLLETDLQALGSSRRQLPACRSLPPLGTPAAAFGCLYVLEGATLGGRFIYRHAHRVLGVTAESGGRFFHGYGDDGERMWRTFGNALTAFATTVLLEDAIVRSAIETFDSMHRWCTAEDVV